MALNFNSTFGNKEISANCPLCKKLIKIRLNQVGTTIHCPFCRKSIDLKAGNNFDSNKRSIDKSLRDLDKTLKNLGK